ncbi:TPA: hypothetical protein ACKPYM_000756 [Stenotrophomonas maltophilia]
MTADMQIAIVGGVISVFAVAFTVAAYFLAKRQRRTNQEEQHYHGHHSTHR